MYLSVSLLRLVESNSVCLKCVSNVLSAHRNVCLRRNNKSERRLTYISASVYEDHVINYKGSRRKHHEEGILCTGAGTGDTNFCRTNSHTALNASCLVNKKQINCLSWHRHNCLSKCAIHTSCARFNDGEDEEIYAFKDLHKTIDPHQAPSEEIMKEQATELSDRAEAVKDINSKSGKKTPKKVTKRKVSVDNSKDTPKADFHENIVKDSKICDIDLDDDNATLEEGLKNKDKHERKIKATTQKNEHDNATSGEGDIKETKETVVVQKDAVEGSVKGKTAVREFNLFDGTNGIEKFLKASGMQITQGHTCYVSVCPKLGKVLMKKQQKPEGERLFINTTSGHFLCEHCKKSGSWTHLMDNITALGAVKRKKEYECFKDVRVEEELSETPPEVASLLETAQDISQLSKEKFNQLLNVFEWQEITQTTLIRYGAKYCEDMNKLTILLPVKSFKGVIVGVRQFVGTKKLLDDEEMPTSLEVTSFPRNLTEAFGWQSVSGKSTTIVITGSEVESLAVIQNTSLPSIALKSLCSCPQELLPYLEQFRKVILWFGNDVKAWLSSKQFAKKLNDLRCHVFRPSADHLSPLEALKSKASLESVLQKTRPIGHGSIVTFNNMRHEVFMELAQIEQVAGVKWQRYSSLNRILKGHRQGELTVLTGPTGSGKTTFVADYSLDLCVQGVNTLWGSFEISNVRLAKVMLSQFAGKSMTKNIEDFEEVANKFAEIPMFFMTYFGQEEVNKVLEAMSHAVYVHDIQHVVVDNLQFMMGMNFTEGNRFFQQDRIIAQFRNFATKYNCHVTLIIHPRKEDDGQELMMSSIFGSAKAVQEADNVLILQEKKERGAASSRKYVQVMKNRFDGELGAVVLNFDRDSLRFKIIQKKSASQKDNEEEENAEADAVTMATEKMIGINEHQGVIYTKLDDAVDMNVDEYYS